MYMQYGHQFLMASECVSMDKQLHGWDFVVHHISIIKDTC